MKTTRLFCLFITAVLLHSSISAQEWRIQNTLVGTDSASYVGLRYSADDYGFAEIDSKGHLKWEQPVPGDIQGMSHWKDKILVWYAVEIKNYSTYEIKELHLLIIDPTLHKAVSDKIVFTKQSKYATLPEIVNDSKGQFKFLLLRTTTDKDGRIYTGWMAAPELFKATNVSVGVINDDGVISTRELQTETVNGKYAGSCAGPDGVFFLASVANGNLNMEQFSRDGKMIKILSTPLEIKGEWQFRSVISNDPSGGNKCNLAIYYKNLQKDYTIGFFRFDFDNKNVLVAPETILVKDYLNNLKEAQSDKIHSSHIKYIDELKPIGIIETADKIILIKEIQIEYSLGNKGSAWRYSNEAGLISVYTKDMKLVRDVVVDKTVENFLFAENGMSWALKNGKLFLVACEDASITSYGDYLYTLDLDNGSLSKSPLLREVPNKSWYLESSQVLWSSSSFLAPVSWGHHTSKWKFKTQLQAYSY